MIMLRGEVSLWVKVVKYLKLIPFARIQSSVFEGEGGGQNLVN